MSVIQKSGKWWIVGHDPEMGPYDTKKEADEDRIGVVRFYREVRDEKERA